MTTLANCYSLQNIQISTKTNDWFLIVTPLTVAFFLLSVAYMCPFEFPPVFINDVFETTAYLLVGLLLVNLGLAAFGHRRKIAHLMMGLLVIAAVPGMFTTLILTALALPRDRRINVGSGIREYQAMADKICESKSLLTSRTQSLDDIAGRAHVFGKTNTDGSLIISFPRRGIFYREAYIYYSGDKMVAELDNTNLCFFPEIPNQLYFHVTNHWYVALRS